MSWLTVFQTKLEAQYNAKRDAYATEISDLKQQLETRSNEVRNLNSTIDSLKGVNEELKVRVIFDIQLPKGKWYSQRAFAVTSAGLEGGKNLAESAQDLERARKAIDVQLAEFDGVKKSLMRDLQNRCEKVGFSADRAISIDFGPRLWSSRSNWTRSRNSTTTSFGTVIPRPNRRRWPSWSATWSS